MTAELQLRFLARLLTINQVHPYADETVRYLPSKSNVYSYFKTGIDFALTKNVGLGFEYSLGEDSPKFLEEEQLSAAFTIQF
jgi:hypothetical protein